MTQVSPLLTPSQVVDRLAEGGLIVSDETVREWCRSGKLAATRTPGGRFLVRPEAVDNILRPVAPASTGTTAT